MVGGLLGEGIAVLRRTQSCRRGQADTFPDRSLQEALGGALIISHYLLSPLYPLAH